MARVTRRAINSQNTILYSYCTQIPVLSYILSKLYFRSRYFWSNYCGFTVTLRCLTAVSGQRNVGEINSFVTHRYQYFFLLHILQVRNQHCILMLLQGNLSYCCAEYFNDKIRNHMTGQNVFLILDGRHLHSIDIGVAEVNENTLILCFYVFSTLITYDKLASRPPTHRLRLT